MSPTSMPGQPASLCALCRQPLHQRDHVGMRPVAVARQPHHLPGVAVDRQRLPRPRCSHGRRSRARASASPPAAPCGRTAPWRRSWDRWDWPAAAAALDRRVPLSCAHAAAALARLIESRSGIRIRRGVIGSLYRASVAWNRHGRGQARQSQLLDLPTASARRSRSGSDGRIAAISRQLDIGRLDHRGPSIDFLAHIFGRLLDRAAENLGG